MFAAAPLASVALVPTSPEAYVARGRDIYVYLPAGVGNSKLAAGLERTGDRTELAHGPTTEGNDDTVGEMTLETSSALLGPRFASALGYAATLHATQLRKGTKTPYISHLLAVAALAIEDGANEDEAIAALLHDAIEDQGGPRGCAVASPRCSARRSPRSSRPAPTPTSRRSRRGASARRLHRARRRQLAVGAARVDVATSSTTRAP